MMVYVFGLYRRKSPLDESLINQLYSQRHKTLQLHAIVPPDSFDPLQGLVYIIAYSRRFLPVKGEYVNYGGMNEAANIKANFLFAS